MAEYIDREAFEQFIASHKIRGDCKFCRNYEICVEQGLNRRGSHLYCWQEVILPAADVAEVRHGEWEIVYGVLTPGGDPLKRCPFCKSRESEHLDGVEFPSKWLFCPICGAKMDGKDGAKNG